MLNDNLKTEGMIGNTHTKNTTLHSAMDEIEESPTTFFEGYHPTMSRIV
jgi:hypothetical protein